METLERGLEQIKGSTDMKPWKEPVHVAFCRCGWKFVGPFGVAGEAVLGHISGQGVPAHSAAIVPEPRRLTYAEIAAIIYADAEVE